MDDLMTVAEVADQLRASESTLRYWRMRGEGPESFRVGRRVVYRRAAVEAWLSQQESAGAAHRTSRSAGAL